MPIKIPKREGYDDARTVCTYHISVIRAGLSDLGRGILRGRGRGLRVLQVIAARPFARPIGRGPARGPAGWPASSLFSRGCLGLCGLVSLPASLGSGLGLWGQGQEGTFIIWQIELDVVDVLFSLTAWKFLTEIFKINYKICNLLNFCESFERFSKFFFFSFFIQNYTFATAGPPSIRKKVLILFFFSFNEFRIFIATAITSSLFLGKAW